MSKNKKGRKSMELTPKEISTLLKASHITDEEIQQWHEDFLQNSPSGQLNKKEFIEYYKRFYPKQDVNRSVEDIFDMIDVNHDGGIDFHEFLVVIIISNHLTTLEARLSFVFDLWDESEDGFIDRHELTNMISAIYDRAGITDRKGDRHPKKRAEEIMAKLDISGDKKISREEFITGCTNDPVIRSLLVPNA